MTTKSNIVIAVLAVLLIAVVARSQSNVPIILSPNQTAITGCTWPTGTTTNGLALCPLSLASGPAIAIAVNGGAFVQMPMSSAGGVTSWNGLTGAVTYAPTTITCTTFSHTNTGAVGSGCTIK